MEVTDKYREKYAKKLVERGQSTKQLWTPAGHEDINRLCDAVDRLKMLVDDCIPYMDSPADGKVQDRLNMILMRL